MQLLEMFLKVVKISPINVFLQFLVLRVVSSHYKKNILKYFNKCHFYNCFDEISYLLIYQRKMIFTLSQRI